MGRMFLSMRDLVSYSVFKGIDESTWLTGHVATIAPFGAFVNVQPPGGGASASGLVHIAELNDGFVEKVEDEVRIGQEVQVRVVRVDEAAGRISLSMRAPSFSSSFKGIDESTWLTGH